MYACRWTSHSLFTSSSCWMQSLIDFELLPHSVSNTHEISLSNVVVHDWDIIFFFGTFRLTDLIVLRGKIIPLPNCCKICRNKCLSACSVCSQCLRIIMTSFVGHTPWLRWSAYLIQSMTESKTQFSRYNGYVKATKKKKKLYFPIHFSGFKKALTHPFFDAPSQLLEYTTTCKDRDPMQELSSLACLLQRNIKTSTFSKVSRSVIKLVNFDRKFALTFQQVCSSFFGFHFRCTSCAGEKKNPSPILPLIVF
jgi:hypothetical protein